MDMDDALLQLRKDNESYKRTVAKAEGQLAERNRSLLRSVLLGATNADVAAAIGVTRTRAGQVVQAARRSIPVEDQLGEWAEVHGAQLTIGDTGHGEWVATLAMPTPDSSFMHSLKYSVTAPTRKEAVAAMYETATRSVGPKGGVAS